MACTALEGLHALRAACNRLVSFEQPSMYKRRDWLFTHGADGGGSDSSSSEDDTNSSGSEQEDSGSESESEQQQEGGSGEARPSAAAAAPALRAGSGAFGDPALLLLRRPEHARMID